MSFGPFRQQSPAWIEALIRQSRIDLKQPDLRWFVFQQPPTDHEQVNSIDVTAELARVSKADPNWIHVRAFDLPKQDKQLVLDESGIIALGNLMAVEYQNAEN